jgi:DNA adenine methylase
MTGSYYGGKGAAGVHQILINQVTPHDTLVIPFAGHCTLARKIHPAKNLILNDIDSNVFSWWHNYKTDEEKEIRRGCGIGMVKSIRWGIENGIYIDRIFVYVDPPYVESACGAAQKYKHRFTDAQHVELIDVLKQLSIEPQVSIMISGYPSPLYAKHLKGWRSKSFMSQTRRGRRKEMLWMSYPQPTELHDYRFVGKDKVERFKLKRRRDNMLAKLRRLPAIERNALIMAIVTKFGVTAGEVG